MFKALLLTNGFEVVSFISERSVFRLLFNGKAEALSFWEEEIRWTSGSMMMPSIIKLNYRVPILNRTMKFCRLNIFKRDQFLCGYCNKELNNRTATVDHITPKVQGGENSWLNCITCCSSCNDYKRDRTPEQAGMVLKYKPQLPISSIKNDYRSIENKHPDWNSYI